MPLISLPPLQVNLPARGVGAPVATLVGGFVFVVGGVPVQPAPVMIEVYSGNNQGNPSTLDATPFNVSITNTAGAAVGPAVLFTSPGVSRICLFGTSFTINAYNLVDLVAPLTVRAYQVPTMIPTSNQLEFGIELAAQTDVKVPPFASRLRWDCPQAARASTSVQILSPLGYVYAEYSFLEQPDVGVPLGGAKTVRVLGGSSLAGRVVYDLQV